MLIVRCQSLRLTCPLEGIRRHRVKGRVSPAVLCLCGVAP
jgi:hypothetical protein